MLEIENLTIEFAPVHFASSTRSMLPCWPLAAVMLVVLAQTAARAQSVPLPMEKPGAVSVEVSPAQSSSCLQELEDAGVIAVRAADFVSSGQCIVDGPVTVEAVDTHNGRIGLPARPILECRFAAVLGAWLKEVVSPVAASLLGSPVDALVTGPGYQCRERQEGKLSEHALGKAIDIAEVRLFDGRRILLASLLDAEGAEVEFLRAVSASACGYFTTVLGPGSDAAHTDHLHVDVAKRKTAEYRICIAR